MDLLITDEIVNLLMIASTFSVILMALIQKLKGLSFIKTNGHVLGLNFLFSLTLGSLFAISFYQLELIKALWVAFFSFIEAPIVYHLLKSQKIINYTPKALDNNKIGILKIPIENEIPR